MGGKADYNWTLDSDEILNLYATENRYLTPSRTSRSSSISSIESDIYFDAPTIQSNPFEMIKSNYSSACPSVYGTPGSLTPINSYYNRQHQPKQQQQQQLTIRSPSEPRYFLNGFHLGDTFLTSFFRASPSQQSSHTLDGNDLTNRLNQLILEEGITQDHFIDESLLLMKQSSSMPHFPHMLPDNHPQSLHVTSPLKLQFIRTEQRLMRLTRKLFHLSFAYKGAVYWVLLYCFLRGPVEHNLKKALTKLMTGTTQQHIAYTTIGITATVAAALSASFSTSLQSNNYNNNKRIRR